MAASPALSTRTAVSAVDSHDGRGSKAVDEPAAAPTEELPLEPMDGATVSFARERARVLSRLDHSASVRRLRRSLSIGIWVWLASILLDVFVTQFTGDGRLWLFLTLRVVVALVVAAVILRLRRDPEPSARLLWLLDIGVFGLASVSLSVLSFEFRGLESAYTAGILAILVARGATTLAPWQQGAWQFAAPALAYPVTVAIASQFDESLADQLHDRRALAFFVTVMFVIFISWAMLVLGGHFAWRLRREAVETRNIGRYKLLRRLGAGGMGDVWAAFDITLRQQVALKTVSGHRPGSPALARLEREVRALSELTHPNIVRVFDYGVTDDGLWYYAMELLHGQTLHELVAHEGALSVERLLIIAHQVLRALGEAHVKGIIHRDIKPENMFVTQPSGAADVVKLLDFGIARASGDPQLTHTGFVAGTPAYMAPETILGRPADARSDIYSFGATLYYALTARRPFPEEDSTAVLAAHLSRPLDPVSSIARTPIPAALERVVERCMAKDPAARYPCTRTLLDALQAVAREHTTSAAPGPPEGAD
jgi:serine/threonine-protein kinase